MDPVGDLVGLASPDPRVRFAAEDRLRAAGVAGLEALGRLLLVDALPEPLRARAADLVGSILHDRAVEAFRAAVPDPAAPDLWAGAVAIAAEAHPALDAPALDREADALAREVGADDDPAAPVAQRVRAVTAGLARAGFRGDPSRADDPRSSYLPDVLERRTGLPIALGVLWMEVARRRGLASAGVGLPLHFVVRAETPDGPAYVDAFHGEVLDEAGCVERVARAAGRPVTLPPRAFRPLRPTEVLLRMLRNLRALHERAGSLAAALSTLDRALHLDPLDPTTLRDRVYLLARMGRPAAAARALNRVLAGQPPEGRERDALEEIRRQLLRAAAARN
ncbi:MAG: tetratricopeptide repeat protein [Planctomycetia bacterium]|nr:tetratricopeptide repeat protein [Planctomycetia bacterium]